MKYIRCAFIGCILCFLVVMGFSTVQNKQEKSMIEARNLKQFPEMDGRHLLEVDYLDSFSDAFSDQIAGREMMLSLYNRFVIHILHQKWAGSIAIGKNNQLYQEPEMISDWDAYEKEAAACAEVINEEAEKITSAGSVFIYLNYPRKDVVETESLPDFYPDSRRDYERLTRIIKEKLSKNVIFIDVEEVFQGKNEVYYTNDHHVNFRGQMLIYQHIMSIVREKFPDVVIHSLADYQLDKVPVNGSFNRRIGYAVSPEPEELLTTPLFPMEYERRNSKAPVFGGGETYASAFMGGDYGNTFVTTELKKAPSILICGSSYTNSLEALCIGSFHTMHSVDFRNNDSGRTLADYAKKEHPDYVVYVPNQSDKHFSLSTFKLHLGIEDPTDTLK